MQVISEDPLKNQVRVNWKTAVKNPYIDKITTKDKIKMVIETLFEDSKMSKKQFMSEVSSVLM